MISGTTTDRVEENRALVPMMAPRTELNLAQGVRLAAAERFFTEAVLPPIQPTDLDRLANRVLVLQDPEWVHVPVDFAEGIHLTGPAATPRLRALWNSFLGLMDAICSQYERQGVGEANSAGTLDLLADGTQILADRFCEFMRLAANLTAEEAETVAKNLPAALEQVSERLPSFQAIGDALTDVRGRLPAPAQVALDTLVQAAPAALAVAGLFSTPAFVTGLVIQALPSLPTTLEEGGVGVVDARVAPQVPPPATLLSRISYTIRQTLGTDRAFFVFFILAFSLCMATIAKIKIEERDQLLEAEQQFRLLEGHCSIATLDTRSFYDVWNDAPQSYEACIAEGLPKV